MIEIEWRGRKIDTPYTLRLYGIDYEMFDELADADTKADLIDGVMIVRSPASPPHSDVARFLHALLGAYVKERRLGEVLAPGTRTHIQIGRKVSSDVTFLAEAPKARLPAKEFEGVPNLVLDVLPPYNRGKELDEKRRVYQDARVQEIWIVDPEKHQIIVDRWQQKRYDTATIRTRPAKSTALPGFWVDPAWLWSDPLPNAMQCFA